MAMDKYSLMSRSKEELVTLVSKLMEKLTKKEWLEFVSKWISPQAALEEVGAVDSGTMTTKKRSIMVKVNGQISFQRFYSFG